MTFSSQPNSDRAILIEILSNHTCWFWQKSALNMQKKQFVDITIVQFYQLKYWN